MQFININNSWCQQILKIQKNQNNQTKYELRTFAKKNFPLIVKHTNKQKHKHQPTAAASIRKKQFK